MENFEMCTTKILDFLGNCMALYFICFVYLPRQASKLKRIACAYADAQWSLMSENRPESMEKYLNYYESQAKIQSLTAV